MFGRLGCGIRGVRLGCVLNLIVPDSAKQHSLLRAARDRFGGVRGSGTRKFDRSFFDSSSICNRVGGFFGTVQGVFLSTTSGQHSRNVDLCHIFNRRVLRCRVCIRVRMAIECGSNVFDG